MTLLFVVAFIVHAPQGGRVYRLEGVDGTRKPDVPEAIDDVVEDVYWKLPDEARLQLFSPVEVHPNPGDGEVCLVVQAGPEAYGMGQVQVQVTVLCQESAHREFVRLQHQLDFDQTSHSTTKCFVFGTTALPRNATGVEVEGRADALEAMERMRIMSPPKTDAMQPMAKSTLKNLLVQCKALLQDLTMLDQEFNWIGPPPSVRLHPRQRDNALRRIRMAKSIIGAVQVIDDKIAREAKAQVRKIQSERIAAGRKFRKPEEMPKKYHPDPAASVKLLDLCSRTEYSWQLGAAEHFAQLEAAERGVQEETANDFFGRVKPSDNFHRWAADGFDADYRGDAFDAPDIGRTTAQGIGGNRDGGSGSGFGGAGGGFSAAPNAFGGSGGAFGGGAVQAKPAFGAGFGVAGGSSGAGGFKFGKS